MLYEVINRCRFAIPEELEDAELFRELNPKWRESETSRWIVFEKLEHFEIVFTEGLKDDN